jgi:hypothetical protein
VLEPLATNAPAAGAEVEVAGLPVAAGFEDPGAYLLLLVRTSGGYALAGPPRSPGYDLTNTAPPRVYRWSDDVRAQAKKLFP